MANYAPPGFGSQYVGPAQTGHAQQSAYGQAYTGGGMMGGNTDYDPAMATYGYNAPAQNYSAPPSAVHHHDMPGYQSWDKTGYGQAPYGQQHPASQFNAYPGPGAQAMGQPYFGGYGAQGYEAYQQAAPQNVPPAMQQSSAPLPDFQPRGDASRVSSMSYTPQQPYTPGGNGFAGSASRAVFPRPDDFTTAQTSNHGAYITNQIPTSHEQPPTRPASVTGSRYSPSKPMTPVDTSRRAGKRLPSQSGKQVRSASRKDQSASAKSADKASAPNAPHEAATKSREIADTGPSAPQHVENVVKTAPIPVPADTIDTVFTARKKAQDAIRSLWNYDVGMPEYVEAGFDPLLIGKLFDDLKLSKAPIAQPRQSEVTNVAKSAPAPASTDTHTAFDRSNQQVGVVQPESTRRKPAVTEKENNLRLKMEALKKSREARAIKKAAKEGDGPPPSSTPSYKQASTAELPKPASVSTVDIQVPSTMDTSANPSPTLPTSATSAVAKSTIPGLGIFAAASNHATTGQTKEPILNRNPQSSPAIVNPRKRPVASDLYQAEEPTPVKRPFGHSRQGQDLVIDVSDDEHESDHDVEMEMESQVDSSSPDSSGIRMGEKDTSASESHSKTMTPNAVSEIRATTVSRASPREAVELESKTRAIEEMKRRIASLEHRKRLSRHNSSAVSPSTQTLTSVQPDKAAAGIDPDSGRSVLDHVSTTARGQSNQDNKKPTASDLQAREAKLRKEVRRRQIAAVLPHVDASIEQKRRELAELEAQQNDLRAALQKVLSDRERLEGEMDKLRAEDAVEEVGSQDKHLEGDATEQAASVVQPASNGKSVHGTDEMDIGSGATASTTQEFEKDISSMQPPAGSDQPSWPTVQVDFASPTTPAVAKDSLSNGALVKETTSSPGKDAAPPEVDTIVDENGRPSSPDLDDASAVARRDMENALQEAVRADADSENEEMMEIEDISPTVITVNESVDRGRSSEVGASSRPASSHEGAQHGDAQMENQHDQAADVEVNKTGVSSEDMEEGELSDGYSPVLAPTAMSSADEDSDFYEPPEAATEAVLEAPEKSPPSSMSFSPASAEEKWASDQAVPATGANEESPDAQATPEPSSATAPTISVEPEQPADVNGTRHESHAHFKPYSSALRNFHAYRYHPDFKHDVKGGLRSMSFSHKIDANKELCRFELAGGSCNDKTCEFQHFRDMNLADDEILRVLGSPDEFTGEARDNFIASLKSFLGDLRQRGIRDFETIADEITAHRASFLGDRSKVLVLEGAEV